MCIETGKILADNFLAAISLHARRAGIPAHHASFKIEHVNRVILYAVEEQPESLLAHSQRLFNAFSLGDVAHDYGEQFLAIGLNLRDRCLDWELLAICPERSERAQPAHDAAGNPGLAEAADVRAVVETEALRYEAFDRFS